MGSLDRVVISLRGIAMAAQYREFVLHRRQVPADIAGIAEAGDRTQGHLLTASRDHDGRTWLLYRLRFEDRVIDAEIAAVKSGTWLAPHQEDQSDGLFHLTDARRRPRRKLPAILLVFSLEPAGANA